MVEFDLFDIFGIGLFDEMKFKIACDLINFAIVERLRL